MDMHTKGIWAVSQSGEYVTAIRKREDLTICDIFYHNSDKETQANARLIAAAPKLLEFVRDIKQDCEKMLNGDGWETDPETADGQENWQATLDSARALIKQATGSEE